VYTRETCSIFEPLESVESLEVIIIESVELVDIAAQSGVPEGLESNAA